MRLLFPLVALFLSTTAQSQTVIPSNSTCYPASKLTAAPCNAATLVSAPGALNDQAARLDSKATWGLQLAINGSDLKPGYRYRLYAVARVKLSGPNAKGKLFGIGLYDYARRRPIFGARSWNVGEVVENKWTTIDCGTWVPVPYDQTVWVETFQDAMQYVEVDRLVIAPVESEGLAAVNSRLAAHPDQPIIVARGGQCGFASLELDDARKLPLELLVSGKYDANIWPDGWIGLVVDYHTPAGYSHRVCYQWGKGWRGGPVIEQGRGEVSPANVKSTSAVKSAQAADTWTPIDIDLNAPADWDGRTRMGVLVRGLETDDAAVALAVGKPWRELGIWGCERADCPGCSTDYAGLWGPTEEQLQEAMTLQQHRALVKAVTQAAGKTPPYILRTESPQAHVFRDRINPSWLVSNAPSQPVKLQMARGEYESAQLAVIPTGSVALKSCRVTASALKSKSGASIAGLDIGISLVDYVEVPKPANGQRPGRFPDPLMPNSAFDVPAGQNRAVMVTMHASPTTPAGEYTGALTITAADAPTTRVPVHVIVWDFVLPKRNHLKTVFWFSHREAEMFYDRPSGLPHDLEYKFLDFLNRYRIGMNFFGPDHLDRTNRGFRMIREKDGSYSFDFSDLDRLLSRCFAGGQNAYNIALSCHASSPWDYMPILDPATGKEEVCICKGYDDPTFWPIYKSFLQAITEHMREKGWLKYMYYQGFDEPQEIKGEYPVVRKIYDFVHNAAPELKRLITKEPLAALDGCVDIWCPLDVFFDLSAARNRQAAGQEVWWYVIGNRFNHSVPPMDARMVFWTTWKYNLSGFLYWSSNWWCGPMDNGREANREPDPARRWPNKPWELSTEFSGQLCYPGPDGPLPSLRLEAIRDGLEDYEYLYLLKDKLTSLRKRGAEPPWGKEADKLLAVPDEIAPDKFTSLQDHDKLQAMRGRIAWMIVDAARQRRRMR